MPAHGRTEAAGIDPKVARAVLSAAKKGDLAVLRAAIDADSGLLWARDKDGSTPLHCASWKGHHVIVEFLLDAGADLDDQNSNGHWGTTPLHAAAHGNQKRVAEILLERGADMKQKNLNGKTPLQETEVHNARAVARLLNHESESKKS